MTIANSEKLANTEATKSISRVYVLRSIDWRERIFHGLFLSSAVIGIVSLAVIALLYRCREYPAFQEAAFLASFWVWIGYLQLYSVLQQWLLHRLVLDAGAVVVGVPVGVLIVIFIAEIAPKRLADIIRPAVELLAGIPSVVYGFFGLVIIVLRFRTSSKYQR